MSPVLLPLRKAEPAPNYPGQRVPVKGYAKQTGVYVPAYSAERHKAPEEAPAVPVPAAAPAGKAPWQGRGVAGVYRNPQGKSEIALRTYGYDADFVSKIKDVIPREHRMWDRDLGAWRIKPTKAAVRAIREHFPNVEIAQQLADAEKDFEEGETPAAGPAKAAQRIDFDTDTNEIRVHFEYNKQAVADIKSIPGRRFIKDHPTHGTHWTVPFTPDTAQQVAQLFPKAEQSDAFKKVVEKTKPMQVEGKLPDMGSYTLFPFQEEAIRKLRPLNAAFLADEMGVGKTLSAIGWAADTGPTLVVAPAVVKGSWADTLKKSRPGDTVAIVNGTKTFLPPGTKAQWVIINYDLLKHHAKAIKEFGFTNAIFDEAHRLKNPKAQRTKAALDLAATMPRKLMVTGTPIVNRPVELFPLLVALGKQNPKSFFPWAQEFCDAKQTQWGWDFKGSSNLDVLRQQIASFYLRREKSEVLKWLPPKQWEDAPVDLTNEKDYAAAWNDTVKWLRENRGTEAAARASKAETLTRLNLLRHLSALGKVEPAFDRIEDYMDAGKKLVVFSSFTEPLKALKQKLGDSALLITGEQSDKERTASVQAFQDDKSPIKVVLCSYAAAGVGITLTAADTLLCLDQPWTPGDKKQAEDRIHRADVERMKGRKSINIIDMMGSGQNSIDRTMVGVLKRKQKIFDELFKVHPEEAEKVLSDSQSTVDDVADEILKEAGDAGTALAREAERLTPTRAKRPRRAAVPA